MELQWNKTACPYLQTNIRQNQTQEETMELRLPEDMPNVGRVICAWGQCVVTSKHWRSDGMTVSGGIHTSVLYQPEDGSSLRCAEAWLPFQARWSFPQSRREGMMRISCLLAGVDARVLSARKMMVRANLSLLGEALEPTETEVCSPGALPEGVEVLTNVYPAVLPQEAREKHFSIEEDIHLPGISKWVSFTLQPELTEQNVVGSRVVMRGTGHLQYVALDEQGQLHFGSQQIPFAQFADLDRDYGSGATVDVLLCVSGLDTEVTPDGVRIQWGITAQYVLKDRVLLEIAEDAYSPSRSLSVTTQPLQLPMELDSRVETLDAIPPLPAGQLLHLRFLPEQPRIFWEGERVQLEIPAQFHMLYRDGDGNLQSATEPWCGNLEFAAGSNTRIHAAIHTVEASPSGAGIAVNLQTWAEPTLPMICDITLGEVQTMREGRPSLLLRPMDTDSLWELAKCTGSTMDAIRKANQLTQEPQQGQMLLIPVI